MTTSSPPRRLTVGASLNFRDAGAYRIGDDRLVRSHRLYRSDAATFSPGDGIEELGLRTVVDLRDPAERSARPTELERLVPNVLHRPLLAGDPMDWPVPGTSDPLGDLYIALLRHRGESLVQIIDDLAQPGALPALVHCSAGKDRTGLVVALILLSLGVAEAEVIDDYALTARFLTDEFFASVPVPPADARLRGAAPRSMAATIRVLNTEFGGARTYLTSRGLSDAALDRLSRELTHPTTTPLHPGKAAHR